MSLREAHNIETHTGLTRALCERILATHFDTLGAECVRRVRQAIKDGIAVAVAGAREKPVELMAAHVKALGGKRDASVWGHGYKTSTVQAACVNAVATHVLDFEPMWSPPTHALSPTLPVAMALAEAKGHTGREIITAVAKGMELQGRIQYAADQFEPEALQFHPTGVAGVMGAAVTAADLLGLDEQRLRWALGIAGSRAGALLANIGSMTKGTHSGHAAAAGLDAALLAQRGYTANADIFETPRGFIATYFPLRFDADRLLQYGEPFRMVEPGFAIKNFPSQFGTHWSITAGLALHDATRDPRSIERVLITAPVMRYVDRPQPETGLAGKFSFQYTAAAALLDGTVGIDTFTDRRRFSRDMRALLQKIELRQDPGIPGDWLNMRLTIEVTAAGRTQAHTCSAPKGAWGQPLLTDEEHEVKLRDCLSRGLAREAVDEVLELLARFEKLDADEIVRVCEIIGQRARKRRTIRSQEAS